jgi:RecA-family ATPase
VVTATTESSSATVIPLQKPHIYCGDLANPPQALAPLCLMPNWVNWRLERDKNGNWTKPPYCASDPSRHAATNDSETWSDRHLAIKAVLSAKADGTGFVQTGTEYAFIDLDKCRNAQTGSIDAWAQRILDQAPDAYHEVTPSGEGLRIIGTAAGPKVDRKFMIASGRKGARIEVFRATTHYCTVTGLELGHCAELPNIDRLIDDLVVQYDNPGATRERQTANQHKSHAAGNGGDDIDYLIEHGAQEGYRSELFSRVVWSLAAQGHDADQIEQKLAAHPSGIAAKYVGRLREEIARCYWKWRARKEAEQVPAGPLSYIDIAREPIPPRRWFVHEKIPDRNVTLFSGEGGRGKSLLAKQLSAATVLARDWIGTLPEPGPVIYLNYEDDDDEICHRLTAIADHHNVSRKALTDDLHIVSLVGQDAPLATFDRSTGAMSPTPLFDRLHNDAVRFQPKLIVLDSSADVFPGNEIDRRQTRQFVTLLRRLSIEAKAATILISHPSLAGIASGSGLSGTTAWHNSTRARAYLKALNEEDGKESSDLRVLEFKKANYGPISESIVLRWRNGLYLPEPRAGSLEQLATNAKVDDLFLDLLRKLTKQGRNVSHHSGTTYAPTVFEPEAEAKAAKVTRKQFAESVIRLLDANKIKIETSGPLSHRRSRLVET